MTRRYVLHFVCILLLLFAQQAALTHAAWHAGQNSGTHEGRHDESAQGAFCSLHVAFGEVLGTIQPASPPVALVPAVAEHLAAAALDAARIVLHLPPARGPPVRS
jgi:hypothetical protein